MNHDSLVTTILTAHGTALIALLAAYHRYGDRNDNITKALQGIDSLTAKIRRKIGAELGVHLAPFVKGIGANVSPILGPYGETYAERPAAFTDSEAFKEHMQKFLEGNVNAIADYRAVLTARNRWCRWARFLSWALLVSLGWVLAGMGFIFVMEICAEIPLLAWQLKMISGISAVTIIAIFLTLPIQLIAHDKLMDLRVQYDSP